MYRTVTFRIHHYLMLDNSSIRGGDLGKGRPACNLDSCARRPIARLGRQINRPRTTRTPQKLRLRSGTRPSVSAELQRAESDAEPSPSVWRSGSRLGLSGIRVVKEGTGCVLEGEKIKNWICRMRNVKKSCECFVNYNNTITQRGSWRRTGPGNKQVRQSN